MRKYGPLTEDCKSCGKTYIDPRRVELSLTGIPADEYKMSPYVFILVIGAFLIWRGWYMLGMYQLGVPGPMQKFLPVVFIILGIVAILASIYEIIMIKTGGKAKKMQKLMEESRQRMKNHAYVEKLKDLGIEVPEELRQ
ncbi:MAG: hypothetical protein K6E84_05015 [Lachnospiraceae bacterium]|nr:hypothetical protein [Lachnospiraceae bacterium]